jgi:hypothetical protein
VETHLKLCTKCKSEKPLSSFYLRSDTGKYRSHCNDCQSLYCKKRWPLIKQRHLLVSRKYSLKKNYGITLEEYFRLNAAQDGKCKICGKRNVCGRDLAVDHNHKTGKVRSLLCNRCNVGLENFDESIALLQTAIAYLEEHGSRNL